MVCQTPQPIHHNLSLTARCGYLHLLSAAAIAASLQRGLVCVARDGSCLAPQRINGSERAGMFRLRSCIQYIVVYDM